ncbi:MAG: LTA synthase family protein [Polyangiaceae bacterium]|nr:LTA synthase family protein [Polyangiaceae bacterium]
MSENGPSPTAAATLDRDRGSRQLFRPKTAVRLRRWAGRALLGVPTLAILGVDLAKRREHLFAFVGGDLVFYLFSVAVSFLLWASLLAVSTRRRGWARWTVRVVLVMVALFAVGGQIYTFGRYQAYVNHRAVLVGTSFLPSIGQQLWFDRWTFARALLPCLAVAVALPFLGSRIAPLRSPSRGWLCLDFALVAVMVAAFVSPERGAEQGQSPDVMYLSAMGQLARARWDHNETVERVHPGPRTPDPVAPLRAKPNVQRNVIMLVTESVRTQSICLEYDEHCKFTPFSNEAVRDRIALTQMRALDSTTAISLAIMWSGLLPTESRANLHSAPILWEYAHAAGLETAYYTSQNLLFGNSGTWLEGTPWTRHVSATMIDPAATYETGADDGALVDYVLSDIGALKEPYFAVVHLSNTHFPYKVDPAHMPFTPQDEATGPGYENEILNRYQDSIYLQDMAVGRLLSGLSKRPEAGRTVVVYVSDHGEQMREKGAVGHTGTLFEPEIRIPFWVDAPKGTLTLREEQSLRALRTTPVTSLDVFPTIMDLLGLWDAPEIAQFKARIPGQSLLRGGSPTDKSIVLTNCTELWACAFKNWGAVRGTKKLIAHQGERAWSCYDVAMDPDEMSPLDVTSCGDLLPLAEKTMGGHPF